MSESPTPADSGNETDSPRILIADRYQVISVIGEGSAARTLLCVDRREARQVVLKELHVAHLTDWKYLELFEREAKMLGRLDHPGIPRVHDFFQDEGTSASFYIVQEYVEGQSLLERMETGPMLGQGEIRDIATGLLNVLEYLHGRAPPVVHRDIKPANILLRADGRPVLIDFGGVRAEWQQRGAGAATVVGTFGYMAPEQFAGHGGPVSDLYSLGATLLHLVTGQSPSEFPFEAGRIEVPRNLPTDRGMAALIEALLRPAPRNRPASAAAARQLLINPPSLPEPASPTVARPSSLARMPVSVSAPRRALLGVAGEPCVVDVGPAPRDPKGAFRDVYRNLMHPLFPARRPWSDSEHLFWIGIVGVVSVVTFGGAPALYGLNVRKRRKQYDHLFREGSLAIGTIVSIPESQMTMHTLIKYEFEVDGVLYRGYMNYPQEVGRYWGVSDAVSVLYDPVDPRQSCLVYR